MCQRTKDAWRKGKGKTLTFGLAFSARSLQPLHVPGVTTPGWCPACPAKHPEVQAGAGLGGSEAPTISLVRSTGKNPKPSGGGISVEISVHLSFSPFRREEGSCSSASTSAVEAGGKVDRWAQTLKSASLGSRASLAQVHWLSVALKGEVAFGSVSEERGWWNVLKHICSGHERRIRWINIKYRAQGTETLFSVSRIPAKRPKLILLGNPEYLRGTGRSWNFAGNPFTVEATEWAGEINYSKAWSRARENRQLTTHYRRFWG